MLELFPQVVSKFNMAAAKPEVVLAEQLYVVFDGFLDCYARISGDILCCVVEQQMKNDMALKCNTAKRWNGKLATSVRCCSLVAELYNSCTRIIGLLHGSRYCHCVNNEMCNCMADWLRRQNDQHVMSLCMDCLCVTRDEHVNPQYTHWLLQLTTLLLRLTTLLPLRLTTIDYITTPTMDYIATAAID